MKSHIPPFTYLSLYIGSFSFPSTYGFHLGYDLASGKHNIFNT